MILLLQCVISFMPIYICFYTHEKTLDKRKTRLAIKYLLDSLLFFLVNLTFKQASKIPINLDLVSFMANISLYCVDGRWLLNKNYELW